MRRRARPVRRAIVTARAARHARRKGLSLLLVLVAVSMSLVVTAAMLRTETTMLQIRRNTKIRERAIAAAETGAAIALRSMQDPAWGGVTSTHSGVVQSDSEGTSEYYVVYEPYTTSDPNASAEDVAMHLVVRSTGSWESLDASERVEREVEVVTRLRPRVTGRTIGDGDSASAEDEVANPTGFDTIRQYTVLAKNGTTSLILAPNNRIDGPIWLYQTLSLYNDPLWSAAIRTAYMQSVGTVLGSGAPNTHPHPIADNITFYTTPAASVITDLSDISSTYTTTGSQPSYPSQNFANWTTYKLYAGGYDYNAVTITSPLSNVTLGPTADNPLGVFYINGSLTVSNNVTIRGTLVCTGQMVLSGTNVNICSLNWRDSTGSKLYESASQFPRLPALFVDRCQFNAGCRAIIDGAIINGKVFEGNAGLYEVQSTSFTPITGTATATLSGQPNSIVSLANSPDLSTIDGSGNYAIWLDEGTSGSYYPIVAVDDAADKVTVLGEVEITSATTYRIQSNRKRYLDVRGHLFCQKCFLNIPTDWSAVTATQWTERYNTWVAANDAIVQGGGQAIPFVTWLSDPANFTGWSGTYLQYGIPLGPTTHFRYKSAKHFWAPPLFNPYDGPSGQEEYEGYRWEVVSWRGTP